MAVRKDAGGIEYDLLLQPGAALEQVRVRFSGARSVELDPSGVLHLETAVGTLRHTPPRAFETSEDGARREIECRLIPLGGESAAALAPNPVTASLADQILGAFPSLPGFQQTPLGGDPYAPGVYSTVWPGIDSNAYFDGFVLALSTP